MSEMQHVVATISYTIGIVCSLTLTIYYSLIKDGLAKKALVALMLSIFIGQAGNMALRMFSYYGLNIDALKTVLLIPQFMVTFSLVALVYVAYLNKFKH